MIPVRLTYAYQHHVKTEHGKTIFPTYYVPNKLGFIDFKKPEVNLEPGSPFDVGVCYCGNRFALDKEGNLPPHFMMSGTHTVKPCQYAHLPPAMVISGALQRETIEHLEEKHTPAFNPLSIWWITTKYRRTLRNGGTKHYPVFQNDQWVRKTTDPRMTAASIQGWWLMYARFMQRELVDPIQEYGPEAVEKFGLKALIQSLLISVDDSIQVDYQFEED